MAFSSRSYSRHVAAFAAAFTLVAASRTAAAAQESGIEVGKRAPAFALRDARDTTRTVNLADVIGKQPIVLEFWATWCGNCKELEPAILAAHRRYRDRVAFYGVAVPINQTLARVQRYVEQYNYTFPMLWDVRGAAAEAYEVPATSYVVIVDRAGIVAYTGVGGKQDLDAAIRKVLAQ